MVLKLELPLDPGLVRVIAAVHAGAMAEGVEPLLVGACACAWAAGAASRVATDVDGQGSLREGGHDPNSAGNVIGCGV